MNREELPQEASREDKMRDALKHYEELATKACWHRSDIPDAIRAYYASLPPAEGAEEIIESIVESLGEPINIHNHIFEIRPYTVEHKTEWWIFHKEVGSGEPLKQWLGNFATLHAQRIADKMVSERLREELIKYEIHWNFVLRDNAEKVVDEYLKSRESHDNIR